VAEAYHLPVRFTPDCRKDYAILLDYSKLGNIASETLTHLMNLFITWGIAITKKQCLEGTGYR